MLQIEVQKEEGKSLKYSIIYGDLLNIEKSVDAIVNSANPYMSRGGGICGIIHKKAGYEFTEYCIKQGGLKVGECKVTPGFNLPYKNVIHVLSPRYDKTKKPREDLIHTYHNVCKLAEENGFKTIAFPLLSGGHYFYPKDVALECAIEALETFVSGELEVYLVLRKDD